jgi:hypothetical protein
MIDGTPSAATVRPFAARSTKAPADLTDRVTVFVTTVGDEPNFTHCMDALARQTSKTRIETIEHVAPMSAAFQRMLDRCETPYYVQVDEDMILDPDAVAVLWQQIEALSERCLMLAAALWDVDSDRAIYGVKIFRHPLVKLYPFRDTFSCEMDQVQRWQADGYSYDLLPLGDRSHCLGLHGAHYNARTAFARWKRVVQKQRRYGWMSWIEPYHRAHLERYRATGDSVHLACVIGMVAGLVGELPPDTEADFRATDPDWERIREKYFPES